MKKIHVDGLTLVDEDGCQVILNGICFICREAEQGYLEPNIHKLIPIYAQRGINCIRLGIFWDGVEPRPGEYDDAYMDSIAQVVKTAQAHGVYVFLDMHQDLFSRKFIDGAPLWATLDEGLPHPDDCSIWYEAYVKSSAVIKTADNFWANAPASDGVGLIDHYVNMWRYIARRFRDYSNLMGYEPMNEPYMGSVAPGVFSRATAALMERNPAFDLANAAAVTQEEQAFMQSMMTEAFVKFDRETLMPFYNRVAQAIRMESSTPVVTGGNVYCSSFVTTGISRLRNPDGTVDKQQIYAPHGYDSVVDTDRYDCYNKDHVSHVFAGKRESQLALGLPVIVGEWGNFPSGNYTGDLLRHMAGILEKYLWSSTYHQYVKGMETDLNYAALERGYPARIAGELMAYHYDYNQKQLYVKWRPEKGGVTRLYVPDLTGVHIELFALALDARVTAHPAKNHIGGWLEFTAMNTDVININVRPRFME